MTSFILSFVVSVTPSTHRETEEVRGLQQRISDKGKIIFSVTNEKIAGLVSSESTSVKLQVKNLVWNFQQFLSTGKSLLFWKGQFTLLHHLFFAV